VIPCDNPRIGLKKLILERFGNFVEPLLPHLHLGHIKGPSVPALFSTGEVKMRDQKGFTLIELLIVVVIIGILAAIAIPKFSATREKAYFAAMKSDLKNLASQQEIYYSDNYTYT
jgi:prepilin-type N-terminal cleavage/methylation domain-containing protein